jgi:uncharacterized membrane protein
MDIYLVVVRLIHIVAAILWVGSGFYASVILFPAITALGDSGADFMKALGKNRIFALIFPVSAVLTVIAGILLYLKPGASAHFTSLGWTAISIGAVAGILAAGHGGAVLGRMTGEYMQKAMSGSAQPGELSALMAKLNRHSNISLGLLIVAMIGMEIARYI